MDMISSFEKTAKNVRNLRAFVKSSLTRQKVKQLNVFRRRVVRCLEDATEYFGWLAGVKTCSAYSQQTTNISQLGLVL